MAHQTIRAEVVTTAPAGQPIQQSIRALLAPSTTRQAPALTDLAWTVLLALPALRVPPSAQFAPPGHMSRTHNVSLARRGTIAAKTEKLSHVQ